MTQSAEIDNGVSQLENVVKELSGAVKRLQTSLAAANADNKAATTTQTLLAATVEALLAKMGTGDIPIVTGESSGTSPEKEKDLPFPKMYLPSLTGQMFERGSRELNNIFWCTKRPLQRN